MTKVLGDLNKAAAARVSSISRGYHPLDLLHGKMKEPRWTRHTVEFVSCAMSEP